MTARRRMTASATAAAVALVSALAACSAETEQATTSQPPAATGEAPPAAADPAAHNDADTEFAQMMIVHHQGAIEMAELAVQQGSTAEVRALAERIAAAQDPEIDLMSGWLDAWGEESTDEMGMEGMDHDGMDMGGMDQEAAMADLSGLSGKDFDRRFLELMTEHHQGAIEMGEEQVTDGENAEAVRLAEKIMQDQTAEIAEMESMLAAM